MRAAAVNRARSAIIAPRRRHDGVGVGSVAAGSRPRVPARRGSGRPPDPVHGGALALERPGRRTRGGARPRRPRGAPGVVAPPSDRRCGPCSRATSAWLAPSSRSPASRRTPSLEAGLMPSCGDLLLEGKRSDQRGTPRGHHYLGRNASLQEGRLPGIRDGSGRVACAILR